MRKLYLILPFLMLLLPQHGQAQSTVEQTLSLSLEDALQMASNQNFSIEQAAFNLDKSNAQYQQTNAIFLPHISFEYNIISTNDPLNVFGFKLKQEVVNQQDFNPVLLNDPGAYENYSAKFVIQQPLFNPDMFMQRSAAKNQLKSSSEQLQGTKNYIQYQVKNLYYSLVLHFNQLEVIESALETAGEHRRQAENLFEEGLISRSDFLAARVFELEMESRKLHTENEGLNVQEKLALLLGLDGSHIIIPTESLKVTTFASFEAEALPLQINNAQTRAIEYRVKAAEKMVQSSEYSFLPKINLFGSYEFNDKDFVGFGASSYMIGANLTWNIFSGFSKAGKLMEARADLRTAKSMQQHNRFEQENNVREAVRSLEHARQELELTDESIRQSTEDVRIRSNRYSEGMERTTDLLEAETKLAEAKLKNLMALYKYNMSIATLNMLLEINL